MVARVDSGHSCVDTAPPMSGPRSVSERRVLSLESSIDCISSAQGVSRDSDQ